MRLEPLPLEDWPAPQMDDETVRSVIKAMDLQSKYHYNCLDAWGLLATTAWPLNLGEGIDNERFTEADKKAIIELSKHIDGFYDQGWHGTYIPSDERAAFIKELHCTYRTSGGRWVYPGLRWDRESFFLPHMQHQATAIKEQFAQGARGIMHYQGPVNNPGNISGSRKPLMRHSMSPTKTGHSAGSAGLFVG